MARAAWWRQVDVRRMAETAPVRGSVAQRPMVSALNGQPWNGVFSARTGVMTCRNPSVFSWLIVAKVVSKDLGVPDRDEADGQLPVDGVEEDTGREDPHAAGGIGGLHLPVGAFACVVDRATGSEAGFGVAQELLGVLPHDGVPKVALLLG